MYLLQTEDNGLCFMSSQFWHTSLINNIADGKNNCIDIQCELNVETLEQVLWFRILAPRQEGGTVPPRRVV